MSCNGYTADTYDRYILGLLDETERSQIEEQIEQQCSICIRGVQRSMNLWLVYATTLDNAEPSADFRARLIRVAELSKRVLTFPKRARSLNEPRVLVSSLLLACGILGTLLVLTWFAGRYSGRMDASRSTAEFELLLRENARYKLDLDQELERNRILEQQHNAPEDLANVQQQKKLEQTLSSRDAELAQYKSIFQRESALRQDNSRFVDALSMSGARLMPLKGADPLPGSPAPVAYAIVVEGSRLIFIGSNLPPPQAGHQYQIWMLRKEEPKTVSAGLITLDEKKHAVAYFDADPVSISGIVAVEVTEEPTLGSKDPTGAKILETSPPAVTSAPD